MRTAYQAVLTKTNDGYVSYVPDLHINSQGQTIAEAIAMTRDAIEMWCCFEEDEGRPVPPPTISKLTLEEAQFLTLIDIDLIAYRKRTDNKAVKKTLTIPSWLNVKAEQANINFSQTLQDALKEQLDL